jgi:hypothetical protein
MHETAHNRDHDHVSLTDPQALAELDEARREVALGDVVREVDAVRALRPDT